MEKRIQMTNIQMTCLEVKRTIVYLISFEFPALVNVQVNNWTTYFTSVKDPWISRIFSTAKLPILFRR